MAEEKLVVSPQVPDGRAGQIGSVHKALDILDLLAEHAEGLGVSQVAGRLGTSPATAYSALSTLLSRGYVEQDRERGKYRLGPKIFTLAQRMTSETNLRHTALPVLAELSARTGETAVLSVVRQRQVWYLVRVQSDRPLNVQLGRESNPLFHSHGQGKVLLAHMSREEVEVILRRTGLPKVGPNTITDPEDLQNELAKVRREGIAYNREESNEGVFGLGAPVRDFTGAVIAAVGFAAPIARATRDRAPEFAAAVKEAANQISQKLGYSSPASPQ